jgi:hypothetical protein
MRRLLSDIGKRSDYYFTTASKARTLQLRLKHKKERLKEASMRRLLSVFPFYVLVLVVAF